MKSQYYKLYTKVRFFTYLARSLRSKIKNNDQKYIRNSLNSQNEEEIIII